ncbi:hypothetical protein DER45DRAFT_553572, partial [Fusarium avenaceum]
MGLWQLDRGVWGACAFLLLVAQGNQNPTKTPSTPKEGLTLSAGSAAAGLLGAHLARWRWEQGTRGHLTFCFFSLYQVDVCLSCLTRTAERVVERSAACEYVVDILRKSSQSVL